MVCFNKHPCLTPFLRCAVHALQHHIAAFYFNRNCGSHNLVQTASYLNTQYQASSRTMSAVKVVKDVAASDDVMCLAYAQDRRVVLAGCVDGAISLWSPEGESLGKVDAHEGGVNAILVTAAGYVLSCGDDSHIRCHSINVSADGTVLTEVAAVKQGSAFNSMVVTSTGHLAACDDAGEVHVYAAPPHILAESEEAGAEGEVVFTPTLKYSTGTDPLNCLVEVAGLLWTGGDDGYLRRWHLADDIASEQTSNYLPSLNVLVVNSEEVVMVNTLTLQGGMMWVGAGVQGVGVLQKRDAVTGQIQATLNTEDWARTLRFPQPSKAYAAFDDGTVITFESEVAPLTSLDALEQDVYENPEEGDNETQRQLAGAPTPSPVTAFPGVAIMDLIVGEDGVLVATKGENLVFMTLES